MVRFVCAVLSTWHLLACSCTWYYVPKNCTVQGGKQQTNQVTVKCLISPWNFSLKQGSAFRSFIARTLETHLFPRGHEMHVKPEEAQWKALDRITGERHWDAERHGTIFGLTCFHSRWTPSSNTLSTLRNQHAARHLQLQSRCQCPGSAQMHPIDLTALKHTDLSCWYIASSVHSEKPTAL